jgi:hypothetical protein
VFEITGAEKNDKLAEDEIAERSTSDGPEGRR